MQLLPARPGTTLPRTPPRRAGSRWLLARPPGTRCPGKRVCGSPLRGRHQRPTARPRRCGSKDEIEKSQASANPDTKLVTQMSAGRHPPSAGEGVNSRIKLRASTARVRGGADGGGSRVSLIRVKLRGIRRPPSVRRCQWRCGGGPCRRHSSRRGKLATYAAGACSAANLAPSPPEAMQRDARRQPSSNRERPMRRRAQGVHIHTILNGRPRVEKAER